MFVRDPQLPARRPGRLPLLGHLIEEARNARRERRRAVLSPRTDADAREPAVQHRRRAAYSLERMLAGDLPPMVDCARYLRILAERQHRTSDVIAFTMVSVEPLVMSSMRARALAVALMDLVHFIEAGVRPGGSVGIYLAVAFDSDRLVVGLGADRDVRPLAPAGATRALVRAATIVRLLRGEFQRGVDGDRMVFGLTFPRSIAGRAP